MSIYCAFDENKAYAVDGASFNLKNGLRVVVLPNSRSKTVGHLLWYPFGSVHDGFGKTGTAHYLEHMMFKGPEASASASFSRVIESLGGMQNAMTSRDYTMYYAIVPSSSLGQVMSLESSRLSDLTVLLDQAESELKVIFEEKRMRFENSPFGELIESLFSKFFQYHPYRNPPIGWDGDLAALTAADCQKFHDDFYAVNKALLVLVGDIDLKKAKQLAEKHYGKIKPRDVTHQHILIEPKYSNASISMEMYSEKISHPYWLRLYPLALPSDNSLKNSAIFSLIKHMLNIDPWGYLFKSLVKEKKVCASASMEFMYPSSFDSVCFLEAEPLPGVSWQQMSDEVLSLVKSISEKGFSHQDLEKAKEQILIRSAYEQDSLLGAAMFFGEHMIRGAIFEDVLKRDQLIKEVTLDEVNAAFRNVVSSLYHVTGVLMPITDRDKIGKVGD